MTTAFAKLGLLFIGGLTLGLVVPWGFGPAKPASHSDDARSPVDRTVTVRCIVEYRCAGADPNGVGGRKLPRPDEALPAAGEAPPPVEVRVQPNAARAPAKSDDVIVIFRLNPITGCLEPEHAAPPKPMPGGM
jgi:hypothetical protein